MSRWHPDPEIDAWAKLFVIGLVLVSIRLIIVGHL